MKSVPSRRGRGGGAAFSKKEQKMRQTKIITFLVMPRNGSQTHTHSVHICLYGYKDALGLSSVPSFVCKLTNRSLFLSNSHTHTRSNHFSVFTSHTTCLQPKSHGGPARGGWGRGGGEREFLLLHTCATKVRTRGPLNVNFPMKKSFLGTNC